MYSVNEWGKLREVVVGVADYANIPPIDISMRTVNYADCDNMADIQAKVGAYPEQVIAEANEDLDNFVNIITDLGVKVNRPRREPTPYYNYCPRDLVFVHGNRAIATPMSIQARHNNYTSIVDCFETLQVAPRYLNSDLYNINCVGNKDILALTEVAPSFDAANVIRANDDLLYLVSNSGNRAGAEYLQHQFPDLRVHLLENTYSYMHIDSTVAFLREGLVLLNPSRINDVKKLPKPFSNWDAIYCAEPEDIGYWGDYCNASPWINMNLLSLDEHTVVLEENQHSLRKQLEQYGIECVMLPIRHQRTLGGGWHCVTCDTVRDA